MSRNVMRRLCVLSAVVLAVLGAQAQSTFTWDGDTDGDWGVATNWDATPTFGAGNNFVFYAPGAGNLNTFLGVNRTIGGLTFNDNADSDIIIRTYSNDTGTGGDTRVLRFDNSAGNAWINVASGATGNILIAPGGGRPLLLSNLVIDHNGSGDLEIGMRMDKSGTGTRSVTKKGTGTLTLSNTSASTAPFEELIINAGKVRLAGQNAAGTAADTKIIMTGGTLSATGTSTINLGNAVDFSGNLAFGDATDTGIVNFTSDSTVSLVGNTTVNTISQLNLQGVVGGDYSLTKTGAGILFLGSNANTFTGGLNINGGTVQAGNHNRRLGAAGGAVSFDGGALSFTGGGNATITRAPTLNAGGGTIGVTDAAVTINWSGDFTGVGGLTKTGAGTLEMNSTGAYEGGLNLNGGVVSVGNANNRLGASGGAVSFDSGTLRFHGGGNATIGAARATTLNAGGGTIDVLNSAAAITWAGAISGVGDLTKAGVGGLILGGASAYTGNTTVSAGLLLIDGSLAAGSAVSVAAGARLGGGGTIGGNLTLADGAFLVFDPTLSLTVSGTVALNDSFGVASLKKADGTAIDWSSIANNADGYTLISTASTFDNIANFGLAQAADIGDGRSAYFKNGSLQLVVIPEPVTVGMLGIGALILMAVRRRLAKY